MTTATVQSQMITPLATTDAACCARRRGEIVMLTLITLAALTPFLNRAFNVDEPLFIWAAEQIRKTPADFYGFPVNWYGQAGWMSDIMKNPPLASYYIALVSAAFGQSEVALHTAFLVPAVALVLGVYRLGSMFTDRPVLAGLLALFSPVTLISAATVMCDVVMLSLWVWTLVLWLRGLGERRTMLLLLAAFLAGACALTKYFGVSLLPLMLVIGIVHHRRLGKWLLPLLVPLAMLCGYQIWTKNLYLRGLLTDLVTYAQLSRRDNRNGPFAQLLSGLAFVGGACLGMMPLLAITLR